MTTLAFKKKNSSLDKLTKELEKTTKGGNKNDERFWVPEVDKAGNGYAVIRFLDSPFVDGDEALPWIQIFNHGFQGPGGWLIDNCPTTINQKCPVCEYNSQLWNSGSDDNKNVARSQKRKLTYISNILVVKDSANPDNEGKVFLFKYGKKIFDKIKERIEPQFEDEKAINPFDFWKGANLKLKIRNVEGYRNYDKSEFDEISALFDGDDSKIEAVWKASHSLKEFVDPSLFKSYDELKTRLQTVLNTKQFTRTVEDAGSDEGEDWSSSSSTTESEDDTLDYFKKLAAD